MIRDGRRRVANKACRSWRSCVAPSCFEVQVEGWSMGRRQRSLKLGGSFDLVSLEVWVGV